MPKITSAASAKGSVPTTSHGESVTLEVHQRPDQILQQPTILRDTALRGAAKRQSQAVALPAGKHQRIASRHNRYSTVDTVECQGQISEIAHKADRICRMCRRIDFEAIFNEDRRDPKLYKIWGGRFYNLSYISPQSSCSLCRFFYSVKEPVLGDIAGHTGYYLKVFPARSNFGAWKLPFDESPGFRVIPLPHDPRRPDNHGLVMELSEGQEGFCGRQIQPQVDLAIIKEWLSFCDDHHKALCKQKSDPQVPKDFCVIDCTTRKIIPWEEIVDQKQYVTLSYTWGRSNQDIVLQEGVVPSDLPCTIEHTLQLTIELGYRYLWIDRYCITQDDTTSRQIQIQSMDIIYQHSVLTVVAAAGVDPDHGLSGLGTASRERQPSVAIGHRTLVYAPYAKDQILSSRWNSRGWTYQEGLLSRRKLVFTNSQVYFQCNGMHCLESIQAPQEILHTQNNARMRDDIDISRVFPLRGLGKSPLDLKERLNEYLKRSLTNDDDIQDAFKGVFVAFQRKFPGKIQSLCGIPIFSSQLLGSDLDAFVLGLNWYSRRGHSDDRFVLERRKKFPSWTWLGWKTHGVHFYGTFYPRDRDYTGHRAVACASIEYADGSVLAWREAKDDILARENVALMPAFLHLHGQAFDVHISTDGRIIGDDEGGVVEQIRVNHDERCGELLVRQIQAVHPSQQYVDCLLKLTFFVSHQWDDEVHILILYQPEGSSCFERVGQISLFMQLWAAGFYTENLTFPSALRGWTETQVRIE
ncbi:heterokaryon incompatibility protein-domain-containing protein [Boeremia exigua]|uniref:heterokaryon incompatibility protein-domain-containing protein n=1 Tax=Boeremia exigua TaxID=749465 RepID=UPI001E8DB906|nr:heterokaryon incompatibility protein-domain-containing protein [Boeremia exigua]KAH6615021.1 heterokaryon incompatibility protein-domain-containing protein [Boeremia exigua]